MAHTILSSQRLRELVRYNDVTGEMTWLLPSGRSRAGDPVGRPMGAGYLRARVDGVAYYVHRLAWLYFYGSWPKALIDHIDGNKANNGIKNLRDVTGAVNQQNRRRARKDSTTGLMGVKKVKERWTAMIRIDGRDHFLGAHDTPEKAHAVYLSVKRRNHPGNTL